MPSLIETCSILFVPSLCLLAGLHRLVVAVASLSVLDG